jgi:hypothetical protein
MEDMRSFLNAGWVGSLVGLVGIVLATFFYLRSRVRTEISYQVKSVKLIGGVGALPADVEIRFQGKVVSQLTRSTCVFWNSGTTTVDGTSIVADDPFRAAVYDGEILSVEIIAVTRSVIGITAEIPAIQAGCAVMPFKFLDPGDGAIIALLHTSTNTFANLGGTIKGLPNGLSYRGEMIRLVRSRFRIVDKTKVSAIASFVTLCVGCFMVGTSLFSQFTAAFAKIVMPISAVTVFRIFGSLTGLIYLWASWWIWRARRRRFPQVLAESITEPAPASPITYG